MIDKLNRTSGVIPEHIFNTTLIPNAKSAQELAFDTLVKQIKRFEDATKADEVVGVMLASFGQSVSIHIQNISRAGQFFCIEGLSHDGEPATLIQHYTQASFLLLKIPKRPEEIKRSIGFLVNDTPSKL